KKQQEFGRSVGVWVERLNANAPDQFLIGCGSGAAKSPAPPPPPPIPGRGGATQTVTNEISSLSLICSSVNLREVRPEANTILAEAVAEELRARGGFFSTNANETKVTGDIVGADTTNMTIRFTVTATLVRPIKL
ncbi:MAG TPA: hypothetical protein VJS65_09260, partial [Verrucomicrobiae bacterium]|nr:hypothetical protein [Verrucomicrobiae bacterium]